MKGAARVVVIVAGIGLGSLVSARVVAPPRADAALEQALVARERASWVAWQKRDASFFETFLSDDHVEVGFGGVAGKTAVIKSVGSPACVVASYDVGAIRLTRLTDDAALLTYHARQQTTCAGQPVPSPVWVSSLYVKRGGAWVNAVYQQTPDTSGR
jgi:hypothetical protein